MHDVWYTSCKALVGMGPLKWFNPTVQAIQLNTLPTELEFCQCCIQWSDRDENMLQFIFYPLINTILIIN